MKHPLEIFPLLSLTFVFCVALAAEPQQGAAPPAQPAAGTRAGNSGAFATRRYRNLFLEAGHSPKEISRKIDAAFQQLFHGDPSTQTVYYPTGRNANGPLAYLTDVNNKDVRSEGMSYGMMIAVQLDRKAEFERPLELV
jgi:oligosaccharide reducing-end xylanase